MIFSAFEAVSNLQCRDWPPESEIVVRCLEAVVAPAFGIRPEAIQSARRGRAHEAFARQVAMYLAHTRLGLPFAHVGACFGRDRTTAAHACRMVEEKREDPQIDAILDHMERAVDLLPALTRPE
jgi:chromosomal replication initiation ATPase DnaA